MSTLTQIQAVIEFAKANGFPKAEIALWDCAALDGIDDCPGQTSVDEAMSEYGEEDGEQEFSAGLYLHKSVKLARSGEYPGEIKEGTP